MNTNFSIVELASLVVSLISTIASIIFGYLSLKRPQDASSSSTTIIFNPKNDPKSLIDNDIITQENNKTKLKIINWAILVIYLVIFTLSIIISYKTIPVINITSFPFIDSIFNSLFYGIGITSKIMSPTISIFAFTLLIESIKIKEKVDRLFNIVVFSVLLISSIVLTIIIFKLDFIAISANTPTTSLTLINIANNYVRYLCIFQVFFIAYEVYIMAKIIVVGEAPTKLISKNIKRLFTKILLPVFTILLIIYWNYTLL